MEKRLAILGWVSPFEFVSVLGGKSKEAKPSLGRMRGDPLKRIPANKTRPYPLGDMRMSIDVGEYPFNCLVEHSHVLHVQTAPITNLAHFSLKSDMHGYFFGCLNCGIICAVPSGPRLPKPEHPFAPFPSICPALVS